jgi:hypothetical protein
MFKIDDVHIHVHVHTVDTDRILAAIGELATTHAELLAQGAQILMANEETRRILEEIDAFTNQLAATQAAQGVKLTEVGNDIDALIAATTDEELKNRLTAHRDAIQAAAGVAQQQSDILTQIAAKHDAPIPPVEPPIEG